ncbi:unnamed protein product [Peronospora belbahrii]|uniref:Uncharacterized protein n=1 Tax=Peronospora belbahrii TaxID=622444 RepID=A0AAU9KUW9_9STRA|nr:unnamed protein product [Peronospora belbahrii]
MLRRFQGDGHGLLSTIQVPGHGCSSGKKKAEQEEARDSRQTAVMEWLREGVTIMLMLLDTWLHEQVPISLHLCTRVDQGAILQAVRPTNIVLQVWGRH